MTQTGKIAAIGALSDAGAILAGETGAHIVAGPVRASTITRASAATAHARQR